MAAERANENRITDMEQEITQLKIHMAAKDKGIEEQKKALVDYIDKEFATHKLVMQQIIEGAKAEFASQRMNLQTLYEATSKELEAMKDRLEEVERKGSQNGKTKFLGAKHMMPRTLDKQEDWKQWKGEVEDYCEEVMDGTKEVLEEVRNKKNTIEETDVKATWWKRRAEIWRLLKRFTSGEARRIITSVNKDNGYEAWRRLHQQYEQGSAMKEAVARSQFTGMVNRRAKTPKETRTLMVELEDKAKKMEEITGEAIEEGHYKSVIAGMIDLETLKQTAEYQEGGLEKFKRKVMEFVNLVMSGDGRGGDSMEIGYVGGKALDDEDIQCGQCWEEEGDRVEIYGLGEACHKCGGIGHYARECPSKGKGKGKVGGKGEEIGGKGWTKGKGKRDEKGFKGKGKGKGLQDKTTGKGKGPQYGGCFTCGGAHFSRDCPKGAASAGAIRSLSSI